MNHGKVARDAEASTSEADATAAKVCKSLHNEHEQRAKYFKEGKIHKYSFNNTISVERDHNDVSTRHCQQSWYIAGVIVRQIRQHVYAVPVWDNKILDRDNPKLWPRALHLRGRAVRFEFTAGDPDSDDDSEEDDYTAERIRTGKPDPTTQGGRLCKVRWKGFAASRDLWEPLSSSEPRYTTVWVDYLKKKGTRPDVKDVLVHLIMHERN